MYKMHPAEKKQIEFKLESLKKSPESYKNYYELSLKPARVVKVLFSVVLILLIAHTTSLFLYYQFPNGHFTKSIVKFFDLGLDANVPTLFSSIILFSSCLLLFYIHFQQKALNSKKHTNHWLILSGVFLFLTVDESIRFHEELMETVRSRLPFEITGYLYNAWVIPYALLVVITVLYFLRFVLNLPKRTRNLIFISGFIYVLGAMGFEMVEGNEELKSGKNIAVHVYETIEELLEMTGVIVFIYTLLDFIKVDKIRFMKQLHN